MCTCLCVGLERPSHPFSLSNSYLYLKTLLRHPLFSETFDDHSHPPIPNPQLAKVPLFSGPHLCQVTHITAYRHFSSAVKSL